MVFQSDLRICLYCQILSFLLPFSFPSIFFWSFHLNLAFPSSVSSFQNFFIVLYFCSTSIQCQLCLQPHTFVSSSQFHTVFDWLCLLSYLTADRATLCAWRLDETTCRAVWRIKRLMVNKAWRNIDQDKKLSSQSKQEQRIFHYLKRHTRNSMFRLKTLCRQISIGFLC